jgi:hypothetical protein
MNDIRLDQTLISFLTLDGRKSVRLIPLFVFNSPPVAMLEVEHWSLIIPIEPKIILDPDGIKLPMDVQDLAMTRLF